MTRVVQDNAASLEYEVSRSGNDLLFTDKNGKQVAMIKRKSPTSNEYYILDSENREVMFMTGWSTPSLAISNMPLYSSSSIIKLYRSEGGEEIERMAVSAQSISSTKMNLSLLDKRDNIIAFLAENSNSYLIKDAHGIQFGNMVKLDGTGRFKINANGFSLPDMVIIKLVTGQILFNSLSTPN